MTEHQMIILLWVVILYVAFWAGKRRISHIALKNPQDRLQTLPRYYGYCTALWVFVPLLTLTVLWFSSLGSGIAHPLYYGLSAAIVLTVMAVSVRTIARPLFGAHRHYERWVRGFLFISATVSVVVTIAIVASVLFEALRFFDRIPAGEFFFGLQWSPQSSTYASDAQSAKSFGAIPVFLGTCMIMLVAMLIAVPIALFSAIYICEYANRRVRRIVKPLLELLAGIPTVVYGFFAVLVVSPLIRDMGAALGLDISTESALAAGLVMGVMIIPFVLSLSEDVMNAVPRSLIEASLGLGATRSETMRLVVLPAALPGIVSAVLLGVSRAIGETMIVVMAAGLSAELTLNPLNSVTTVTVQIVTLLVGDSAFDSPKTLAAFALGLALFFFTLLLNIIALYISRTYQEKYE